ncbi:MAG TPA: STAS/SEC14 domain-containing protein [Candidatus Saccharimonadales bacterium]|nr:STAS/SEC14 domain-containing protein [Candidatus Saccharimonadales bacterium]
MAEVRMPISIIEKNDGKILEVHMSGKLTRDDYQEFIPVTERLIKEWGKFNLVVVMRDFHGWEIGAVWEDVKWDFKHFSDIDRVALVGEKKWQAGMSKFCKPFTNAEIRYFDVRDIEQARLWVQDAIVPAAAAA